MTRDPDESVFYRQRASNQFDRIEVDADEVYARFPLETRAAWPCAGPRPLTRLEALSRARVVPLRARAAAMRALTRLRIEQRWFTRFQGYWTDVLGGRPLLSAEDFHFLRGVYRIRHQDNQVPDTTDSRTHLEAWQRPELVYQVFNQAWTDAIGPKHAACAAVMRHLKRAPSRVLEYGSASAPVTTTWLDFHGPSPAATFYVSDIKTLAFHYAAYKFRREPNVIPLLLSAEHDFNLPSVEPLDAIWCLTVFEHVPVPLATARQLHAALRPGGLLVFDYLRTDGEGLDSAGGVREREATLRFIDESFEIVSGRLDYERSMDLTAAVRR